MLRSHALRAVPKTISYADISLVLSGGGVESGASPISLTGVQTDDVIFVFMANVGLTFTAPTGYTQVDSGTLLTNSPGYYWRYYYKVMGPTPDSTISIAETNNDGTAYTFYALRNVDTSNPILTSAKTTTTTNPPAVTTDRKSMILVAGFGGSGSSSNFTAAPSGYSNFLTYDAAASADANVGSALKSLSTAATEDPGAWSGSLNWGGVAAVTIAVNPKTL